MRWSKGRGGPGLRQTILQWEAKRNSVRGKRKVVRARLVGTPEQKMAIMTLPGFMIKRANGFRFYAAVETNKYRKIISMKSFKPDSTLQQTIVNNYQEQIWVGGSVKDSNGRETFSTVVKLNENLVSQRGSCKPGY